MIECPIPMNVQSLLAEAIDSVGTLELLLLLYRDPSREWSAAAASEQLRVERRWACGRLESLTAAGLACRNGDRRRNRCYRYYPSGMERNAAVAELARTYAERPLAVHAFVHSRPVEALRRFAGAFVLRDNGGAAGPPP
jgi:hypothetical protein